MANLVIYDQNKKAVEVLKDLDGLTISNKHAKWNGGELRDIQTGFIVINDDVNQGDDVTNLIPNDISAQLVDEQTQMQNQLTQTQTILNNMLLS
jgi:hypothetical protein